MKILLRVRRRPPPRRDLRSTRYEHPVDRLAGTEAREAHGDWRVDAQGFVNDGFEVGEGLGAVALDVGVGFEGGADFGG